MYKQKFCFILKYIKKYILTPLKIIIIEKNNAQYGVHICSQVVIKLN